MLLFFFATVAASPFRPVLEKPPQVVWHSGVSDERVIIKLHDDVLGTPLLEGYGVSPILPVNHARWAEWNDLADGHDLAQLSRYFLLEAPQGDGVSVAQAFNEMDWVELAYLAPVALPPPGDLEPGTPDFRGDQQWLDPAPDGVDRGAGLLWPGGQGSAVKVADLEYSWDTDHEDLETPAEILAWGYDSGDYKFHGTAVLGQLFAVDNGFGVQGLVPNAEPVIISPYQTSEQYSVAQGILGAMEVLGPGDVLLIEQQAWFLDQYAPVEVDPLVFDAIALAVAAGIVVVEPTGNGAQNLDDPAFEGIFDREIRDSGAILVGGGEPPGGSLPARSWVSNGSSYGERVDVQGWASDIVTTINGDYNGAYADLFYPETEDYPDGDPRQAYTTQFAGTSGASPMVAGVVAAAQSVAITLHGEPVEPFALRSLLIQTGTPQPTADKALYPIGPLPDLRRLLSYGLLP
jgi:serine protease